MAKEKKPLTVKQKQTKYRALQYTTFVGEFVSVLTPFIIMGAVNADEWFVTEEGWKVGLGGALAMALMGIAIFMITKKKENDKKEGEKMTYAYISLIMGWFAAAFIFVLLASIMEQIATIMFYGGIGLLGAFGLDITSQNFKKKADLYKEAIKKIKGEKIEDEVRQEIFKEVEEETQEEQRRPVE